MMPCGRLRGTARQGLGAGGMATKLEAATTARRAGTEVLIANGGETDVLLRIAAGEPLGTRFRAQYTPPENRKRWILAGAVNSGSIVVDRGAAQALRTQGRSLLPAGVMAVEGEFDRGIRFLILYREAGPGSAAAEIARGSHGTRVTSCDASRVATRTGSWRSWGMYGPVAVHRNDMIVL